MRVLVATTAGAGHFGPLLPFAHACVTAGHDVRVAAPASFSGAVARAGLAHAPFADAPAQEMGAVFERLPHLSLEEANAVVMRDVFAGLDARAALPGLTATVQEWRPDAILRETAEFGSYAVADVHGIPHVEVAIGLARLDEFSFPLLDDALGSLGSTSGVAGLRDAPVLSTVPASLDTGVGGRVVHRFRYESPRAGRGLPAPWGDAEAPLVYASFGTSPERWNRSATCTEP